MADKESEAHDLVRRGEWAAAIQIYDPILNANSSTVQTTTGRIIGCLIGRSECCLELKNFESVIGDCQRLLKMLPSDTEPGTTLRIHRRLVHSLYQLKRFKEAEAACDDWISIMANQDIVRSIIDRYRTVIQIANGQQNNQRIPTSRLDDEISSLDQKLEALVNNDFTMKPITGNNIHRPDTLQNPVTVMSQQSTAAAAATVHTATTSGNKTATHSERSKQHPLQQIENLAISGNEAGRSVPSTSSPSDTTAPTAPSIGTSASAMVTSATVTTSTPSSPRATSAKIVSPTSSNTSINSNTPSSGITCSYCAVTLNTRADLRAHCQTDAHQNVIMSDEGRQLVRVF